MHNLTNLYEVIKTLKFELKPSIYTQARVSFDLGNIIDDFENHDEFLKLLELVIVLQRNLLSKISQSSINELVIHKDLIKKIDADFFYTLKKDKLSKNNTISGLVKKYPSFKDKLFEYICSLNNELGERFHKYHSFKDDIGKVYTKTDKAFAQKQLARILVKTHETLILFPYSGIRDNISIREPLQQYFELLSLEDIINTCKRRLKSYNPQIGYHLYSFGLNAKAINKKADVDGLKQDTNKLEKEMDNIEEQLSLATSQFDEYTKHFNEYVIHGKDWDIATRLQPSNKLQKADPKLKALQANQTSSKEEIIEAKQYLKQISNGDFDYQEIIKKRGKAKREGTSFQLESTGDQLYADLKLKKTDLSVVFGRKKGDFFAKQQELFHQEQLTHYARLMRDGESYFVVMVSRDNIALLDNIQTTQDKNNSYQFATYSSLTSKAVEKLIFERDALRLGRDKEFQDCKKIREKRSYKQKNSTETKATSKREKQDLVRLVTFMNHSITRLNKEMEGNTFDRKPFSITDQFNDFNEFRRYITKSCYHMTWKSVDMEVIRQMDRDGKIDVYQIYNKDFTVHPMCATTERDKKEKQGTGNPNLFTLYWESLFADIQHDGVRLNPESRVYLRPAKQKTDIDEYKAEENGSKIRFRQNKVIADFQLIFYPTKELSFEQLQNTLISSVKGGNAIGIDLGENSLAMICLIDNNQQVVKDNSGKSIIYDLTMINTKGEFVEEKECFLFGESYKRKKTLCVFKNNTWHLSDRYFSKNICKNPIKELSIEQLQQAILELEKLSPKNLDIYDKDKNKVFDYAYAFEHLKTTNKIRYHIQSIKDPEEDKIYIEKELLETTTIRNGYISKVVSFVTKLAQQYDAMIVFENLDQTSSQVKGITLLSEKSFEKVSSKDKRLFMGISPYQLIQNKIIQKCNYLLQKDGTNATQSTPRLKKIDDIKQLAQLKGKDCAWGTVVFIDEARSSQQCPHCDFYKQESDGNIKPPSNGLYSYSYLGKIETFTFDTDNILLQERLKLNPKKIGDLIKTRVKYTDLVKEKLWYIGDETSDPMVCINCGYDTRKKERVDKYNLKSCDEVAAYIIAKRGREFINSGKYENSLSLPKIEATGEGGNQNNKQTMSTDQDINTSSIKSNIQRN